jgi:hypothetical protein
MNSPFAMIVGHLRAIADQLENDETSPELEEALQITRDQLSNKALAIRGFMAELDASMQLAQAEKKRLDEFINRKKKIYARLEFALLNAVLTLGNEQKNGVRLLEIGTLRLSTRKSEGVVITDEIALRQAGQGIFFRVKLEPDKDYIKYCLKKGEEIPGAILEERENLVIK